MKKCSSCQIVKPMTEFYSQKNSKDGLRSMCKFCYREKVKEYDDSHKEQKKKYDKEYVENNREKILNSQTKYYHKIKKVKPWIGSYAGAKKRCNNPSYKYFHRYGGRGIKFLLTQEDCKYLWERDFAFLMKQPSLDRIDNNGNYEIENCRFIELSENAQKSNSITLHLTRADMMDNIIKTAWELSKNSGLPCVVVVRAPKI